MLWPIAVLLIALWLLGLVPSYTMGGFIHIVLVIAVIVVIVSASFRGDEGSKSSPLVPLKLRKREVR